MRRFSALTIAGLVAASLTACGGSDSAGSNSSSPSAGTSAPAASAVPNALTLPTVAGLLHEQLTAKKSVRMNLSTADGGQGTVAVSIASGTPELDITMTSEGETVRMIKTKDAVFMEEKDPKQQVAPGKTWTRFAADSKNPLAKLMLVLVGSMSSIADTAQQKSLMVAGGTLSAPVAEQVGGVAAQRYTVSIDMTKALDTIDLRKYLSTNTKLLQDLSKDLGVKNDPDVDRLANLSDADLAKLKGNMLKAVAGKPLTYEIWADAQNVPVKYSMEFPTKTRDKATITLSDWGTATVTAPPPAQVADMPDLPSAN
ncbi:hypothetical protein SMC26_19820 [Actinomadura fulvescens]|uniref:Lipoprotein n=1 Tax=Actinomadura fulvescens TaxID=46160 RepID=A0ABP6C4A9_9ACTN